MAVDTRDKRMSMLGLARATVRLFKNPTGTIAAVARAMFEFLYAGITLGPPTASTPRVLAYQASRATTISRVAARGTAPALQASRATTIAKMASEL